MGLANHASVNGASVTRRYDLQYRFWLNANDDAELWLADEIAELKSKRSFTRTVRDGIRLVIDLRNGKTDVLFELFPWVKNLVIAAAVPPSPPISRATSSKSDFQGDEIVLEVKQATATEDNKSNWNFMIASAKQVYGTYDLLPDKVIEYGIRTGRIPQDAQKPKPKPQGIKKIAGADQALTTPTFDDLELGAL